MSEQRPTLISITPQTVLIAILMVLGVWALFALKNLVLIVLTAVVLASSIEPAVEWFKKRSIPRPLGVLFTYLIIFGVLFGVFYTVVPPLLEEASGFIATAPQYLGSIDLSSILGSSSQLITDGAAVVKEPSLIQGIFDLRNIFASAGEGTFRAISGVFGGIVSFVLIVVLSFYFAVQETGIDDFLRIVTPVKYQSYVIGLWKRSHKKIGLWMQGQVLLSLLVGVLVYLWLTILGVPYSLLLAILAALTELIPVFGSYIAAVPAVAIAGVDGGISLALLVAGGFLVINQLEAHLIYPLVVKKVVGVAPLLVILSLIAGAQLAGFLGVLLSVPFAAAIQELVSDIEKRKSRELAHMKAKEE